MSLGVEMPAPGQVGSGAASRLLEVRALSHRFGDRTVLDNVDFGLSPGELLGLLGPNGCGKSTTLRVLSGLLMPDTGSLFLRGERVMPGDRALRRALGVVFQSPSLDARLSGRENLKLSAALHGLLAGTARERVQQALEFAQLEDRADEAVGQLSGGMKRRLELARALLHDPRLLLLDEPTSGLDEASYRRTWQQIDELRQRTGLGVILATHRADEAALCDRVAVLDQGRIVALDTPQALIAQVSGDVLTLEMHEPPELFAERIERQFAVGARVVAGQIVIERERGHELIPRLVEALPAGSIRSLSMHRPSLADVFVKLTGHALGHETDEPAADPKKSKAKRAGSAEPPRAQTGEQP